MRREYWIQAQTQRWRIVPSKRDDWQNRSVPGKTTYRAYTYTEMTAGFAAPKHGPSIPGPTLYAEVGDVLVVHFRNADRTLRQAVTMHPHGVKYNPEYDGAFMGEYTRAGGFVGPGETFTTSGSARRSPSARGRTTTTVRTTGDVHEINLKSAPKGVKEVPVRGVHGLHVQAQLTVPGSYGIVCPLHTEDPRHALTGRS